MKRYIRSSYDDDPWKQTELIDPELGPNVSAFMQLDAVSIDDWNLVKEALNEFWSDYERFPDSRTVDSLDIRYSDDQRRFYRKYYDFAKRCKQLSDDMKRVSGYGRMDAVQLEIANRLGAVAYHFPYGWRYA